MFSLQTRDPTPDSFPTKSKKKGRGGKKKAASQEPEETVPPNKPEEDFIVNSNKSKTQKNIKVDPENTYKGNILDPESVLCTMCMVLVFV